MITQFRTAYGPHFRVTKAFTKPSMAKQAHKEECDVNAIMKRFERTGMIEHQARFEGRYGDFVGAPEYHEAMNMIVEAQEMFDSLPAPIRKRFDNDPSAFLEAVNDNDRVDELRELGVLLPAEPTASESEPEGSDVSDPSPSADSGS